MCKLWQLYGGICGKLLQEGLCHTQVYCTQSPCLCSSPLLTRSTTGDTQAQFFLSLCEVSGSWFTQGLFEPSEHLWKVWNLILNVILPPPTIVLGLLLCPWMWGISSKSLQCLPSCWSFSVLGLGYLLTAAPAPFHRHSSVSRMKV